MAAKPTLNALSPLTAAIISQMKSGHERGDSLCRGLRVRCLAGGAKIFFYRYRAIDSSLREIRLGEFGALTLAKAREIAGKKRQEREEGRDPQLERRKERQQARQERAARQLTAYTVTDLVEEYIREALTTQKRGVESERLLRKDFLPVFGSRAATSISRRELLNELIRPKMLR